jgi:hypothetical protein
MTAKWRRREAERRSRRHRSRSRQALIGALGETGDFTVSHVFNRLKAVSFRLWFLRRRLRLRDYDDTCVIPSIGRTGARPRERGPKSRGGEACETPNLNFMQVSP